jgi:hypothetical protein
MNYRKRNMTINPIRTQAAEMEPAPHNPLPDEVFQQAVLNRLTLIEAQLRELAAKPGPAVAQAKPKPEPIKLTDEEKEYIRKARYPSDCTWMLDKKPDAYQAAIVWATGQQFMVKPDVLKAIVRRAASQTPPDFAQTLKDLDRAY